jgi:methionine-S-sulfoxide reductase
MKIFTLISSFLFIFCAFGASKGKSYKDAAKLLNQIPEQHTETAVLAGGCFWGMEDIIRKIPGVISTDVGYSGGNTSTPNYSQVKTGQTGHAEAVKIEFDKRKLSYDILLDYFFRMHDPTTLNQQGNDKGTQYRSAIFYMSPEQKRIAEEVIKKTNQAGKWDRPIVTEVTAFKDFTKAEDYHQDYLVKNPQGYTCHWLRK